MLAAAAAAETRLPAASPEAPLLTRMHWMARSNLEVASSSFSGGTAPVPLPEGPASSAIAISKAEQLSERSSTPVWQAAEEWRADCFRLFQTPAVLQIVAPRCAKSVSLGCSRACRSRLQMAAPTVARQAPPPPRLWLR